MHGVVAFSGDMVVAMTMTSPRICCRSAARERMDFLPPICWPVVSGVVMIMPSSRFLRMALAVAIAGVGGEWESTATRAFHYARECDGIRYLNIGTRGVMTGLVGTRAGGMRSGSEAVPRISLWSRN